MSNSGGRRASRRLGWTHAVVGGAMGLLGLVAAVPARAGIAPPVQLIGPFQCYEAKPKPFAPIAGVVVIDRFGLHIVRVRFPHRLCAPAFAGQVERGGGPGGDEHLIGHVMLSPNISVLNQPVVTQFGSYVLDVRRPDILMVPTLKSLTQTPPPLPDPGIDHFQCYKVRRSHGGPPFVRVNGVPVVDQFGSATVDLVGITRLCVPADKNGEDPTAPSHPQDLLCYRTRNSRFGEQQTYTNSQFGPAAPLLIHRRELCVPATRTTPTTTTSTSTSTTMAPSTTFPPSTTVPPSTTFPPSTTVPTSTTTTTTFFPTSTTFPP